MKLKRTNTSARQAHDPAASDEFEIRLRAASAIIARIALRIAAKATDGAEGNPATPHVPTATSYTEVSPPTLDSLDENSSVDLVPADEAKNDTMGVSGL